MLNVGVCRPYSIQGKIIQLVLTWILKAINFILLGSLKKIPKSFEEDPKYYKPLSIQFLHFAYKYYAGHPKEKLNGKTFNNTIGPQVEDASLISSLTLHICGDLMPYENLEQDMATTFWSDIGQDFFSGDLIYGNLETPILSSKPRMNCKEFMLGDLLFNGDESFFNLINGGNYRGFDILSTANNHSMDMGKDGIIATLDFLEKRNILAVGTHRNQEEKNRVKTIERNGIKIGFIAWTYSLNNIEIAKGEEYFVNHTHLNSTKLELSNIINDSTLLNDAEVDFKIGALHFGNAYQIIPSDHIRANAKAIFEATGLDLIIGNHAHNLQPMEVIKYTCKTTGALKSGYVIYALGDFIGNDIFEWCCMAAYLKIRISKTKGPKGKTIITEVEPKVVLRETDEKTGKLILKNASPYFDNNELSIKQNYIKKYKFLLPLYYTFLNSIPK